ncbi:MAG: hypothetical protein PHS05_11985 [Bacteroidales bacterium]|nr:hypothetical protein [Bacteroidales bacterium]
MNKIRVVILKNEDSFDHEPWLVACESSTQQIEYCVIDLTKHDWIENIVKFNPDVCLLKPSGKTSLFRTLYQERVEVIVRDLGYKVFPSYDELRIYENKRYFAYWAKANQLPHPQTCVFYSKKESVAFSKKCNYPIVAKLNIGASGNGVKIIKSSKELGAYIDRAFSEGIASRIGPKLGKGKLFSRLWNKILHPKQLINRLKTYSQIAADKQKGFVVFQEFIPHDFEWRAVRIGDSFFAHKKLKVGEKASGTLLKEYSKPPLKLLGFVKEVTDKFNFRSVAVDIFETPAGDYLVNEIQCIFGQSDPYQMLVYEKPGRYIYKNSKWVFEAGDFNKNQSYNLRLEAILGSL